MNNQKLLSLVISCAIVFSVALLPIANITTVAESVKTYTVTASVSGAGGTVSPDSVLTVTSGKSVTCTVTPDDGYVIKDVL
ncbi:MAG: hypothetical protein MJ091_05960, partial [Clostridia bacterium]|nr:hypothetical protein [Clostridia bacterium]